MLILCTLILCINRTCKFSFHNAICSGKCCFWGQSEAVFLPTLCALLKFATKLFIRKKECVLALREKDTHERDYLPTPHCQPMDAKVSAQQVAAIMIQRLQMPVGRTQAGRKQHKVFVPEDNHFYQTSQYGYLRHFPKPSLSHNSIINHLSESKQLLQSECQVSIWKHSPQHKAEIQVKN